MKRLVPAAIGLTIAAALLTPAAATHAAVAATSKHPSGKAKKHSQIAVPGKPMKLGYLHVGGTDNDGLKQIEDAHGRSVLLRGVNVDGLVDYWQSGGKTPYPINPKAYANGHCPADDPNVEGVDVCRLDFPQMEPLGYDVIRLNISWSLLEPKPGHIDATYIDRIAQVVRWAKASGLWVVIDMHQDSWSKFTFNAPGSKCAAPFTAIHGQDGAPKWATTSNLTGCSVKDKKGLALAAEQDAQDFYSDQKASDGVGLQEHYAHAVAVLAHHFAGNPTVAGYDLMNEPLPGAAPAVTNTEELLPFYSKVIKTIRQVSPGFKQLIFIEPDTVESTTLQREFFSAWQKTSSYSNVVYAPHIYTDVFTKAATLGSDTVRGFDQDYGAAVADAKALGLPLWIGEFGCAPNKDGTILTEHYLQQESLGIGGTMWIWKENNHSKNDPDGWGVYHGPFDTLSQSGVELLSRAELTSRVYPVLTHGTLVSEATMPSKHTASFEATSTQSVSFGNHAQGTLIAVPSVFKGPLRATGARISVTDVKGERLVWMYPHAGKYSLRVLAPL